VSTALPRWDDVLDPIGEEQCSDAIIVAHGGHCQDGGELRGQLALEATPRAEAFGAREVDDQHHGQLALLDVALHERAAHARRDVPVDDADLVAGLVLAHLGELHPLPLED
jgi:hypothetical protein